MDNRESLRTFMTGENFHLQHYLGAHKEELNGVLGYRFRVWAPNAQAWREMSLVFGRSLRVLLRKDKFISTTSHVRMAISL